MIEEKQGRIEKMEQTDVMVQLGRSEKMEKTEKMVKEVTNEKKGTNERMVETEKTGGMGVVSTQQMSDP